MQLSRLMGLPAIFHVCFSLFSEKNKMSLKQFKLVLNKNQNWKKLQVMQTLFEGNFQDLGKFGETSKFPIGEVLHFPICGISHFPIGELTNFLIWETHHLTIWGNSSKIMWFMFLS